uniref:Transposase n=1 Tax=Globodera rostochiensis TaxID=31243 RepID=A0A914HP95_GLORO
MPITKSTGRTPKLDKLNPIQLISLDKLDPIQLIRIFLSQSLITLIMLKMSEDKFDQMKAELTRAGFKNSYHQEIDETVAKELGVTFRTIYTWKKEFGQTKQHKHSHSEQMELMKRYYKIKGKKTKISDEEIAKMLKIRGSTLYRWKKQFHPNSVDGHSVEVNAAANVHEIGNSNSQ